MQDMQATSVYADDGKPDSKSAITEDEHMMLVGWFEEAEETCREARELAHRCRDYYDTNQLTAEQIKTLKKRGQPPVQINKVASKVNFLLGLEKQQRTDPKGYAKSPADEEGAHVATDSLRYVEEREKLDSAFSLNMEDMLIEGVAGIEVGVRDVPDQEAPSGVRKEVDVKLWRYDRLFWDPHSQRHDFEDARYRGGVIWMDRETAIHRWPHAKDMFFNAFYEAESDQHYDDKPAWKRWTQSGTGRDRIRIVQIYYKMNDAWKWAIYCKSGVLEGGDVPYLNGDGEPECPLELQSCFIDRQNNRYGLVKQLLDPQDEVNKRRSKLLHMLSVRQTKMQRGAVDDEDKVRKELAKPDGLIITNPGYEFEVLPTTDMASGQVQLLQHAQAEMDEMGANNALRGVTGNQASGRAIQASQQGGQLEIGPVQDRHTDLKLRVYNQVWNRIAQYWTEERIIRVSDNEQAAKYVELNKPVTLIQKLAEEVDEQGEKLKEQGASPEQLEQFFKSQAEQIQMQYPPEELKRVVDVKNSPSKMGMDIVLDVSPDTVVIQQEQFEELNKLLSSGMEINDPRFRLLVMASTIRNKKELLDYIDDQQKSNPMQQQAQQMQLEAGKAELEKLKAEIAEMGAKIQKIGAETAKIQAETESTEAHTEIDQVNTVTSLMQPQPQLM